MHCLLKSFLLSVVVTVRGSAAQFVHLLCSTTSMQAGRKTIQLQVPNLCQLELDIIWWETILLESGKMQKKFLQYDALMMSFEPKPYLIIRKT